jgi:hypothetical protein
MVDIAAIENRATISRTTAGVYKYHGIDPAGMDLLHRYSRDVHAPAISRRPGIHLYRHFDFGPVRQDLFAPIEGVGYSFPESKRLTGAGHLDYLDERALQAFYDSPDTAEVRKHLLDDIYVLGGSPGRTTTYRTTVGNARTYLDLTGNPTPQGPEKLPHYAVFLRRRSAEGPFREFARQMAVRWSQVPGVLRLRLFLFDVPDMQVESNAGYPIFPAPADEHYEAWMDLIIEDDVVAAQLISGTERVDYRDQLREIHVQPVPVVYTYVWDGRPTEVGLRGYPAYALIEELGAANQREPSLLRWMYGPVADGAPY